jgi:hypothetical protein
VQGDGLSEGRVTSRLGLWSLREGDGAKWGACMAGNHACFLEGKRCGYDALGS